MSDEILDTQVTVVKKSRKKLQKILSIVLVVVIVMAAIGFGILCYIKNQLYNSIDLISSKHYSVKLSDKILSVLPTKVDVKLLMIIFEFPLTYSVSNQEMKQETRFIDIDSITGFNDLNEGISPISFKVSNNTFDDYEKDLTFSDIEIDYEWNTNISDLLNIYWKKDDVEIYIIEQGKVIRTLTPSTDYIANELQALRILKRQLKNFNYSDLVLPTLKLIDREQKLDFSETVIEINNQIVDKDTKFYDYASYSYDSQDLIEIDTPLKIKGHIGNLPFEIISSYPCKDDILGIHYETETKQVSVIFNDYHKKELGIEKDQNIEEEIDEKLNGMSGSGISYFNDYNCFLYVNSPKTINNHDDVANHIIDEDLTVLSEAEKGAIKKGIKKIPLSLWQDALMNFDFNVRVLETKEQVENEYNLYLTNDSEELDFYLNKNVGFCYYKTNQVNDNSLDVVLNLYRIDSSNYDFYKYNYFFNSGNRIDPKTKLSFSNLENHKNNILYLTFLHEMGHFFDMNNNSNNYLTNFSHELFTGWNTVAKNLYSDDYYHSSMEFFAETFSLYFAYPEKLKAFSETTYEYFDNLIKTYSSINEKEIKIFQKIN